MGKALAAALRLGDVFLWAYVGVAVVSLGVLAVVLAVVGGTRG